MNRNERYHELVANLKKRDLWRTKDEFISCFDFIVVELLGWGEPWMHSSLNNQFLKQYREYRSNPSVEERIQRSKNENNIQKIIRK